MKNLSELRDTYRAERAAEFSGYARAVAARAAGLDLNQLRLPDRVKEAISAITADDIAASPLQSLASSFLASLGHVGAFDAVAAAAQRVPVEGASAVRYSTSAITGSNPAEAQGKPLARVDIGAAGIAKGKGTCELVLTREALRDGGSDVERLIATELRRGVTAATDFPFLAAMAASVTPISATGAGGGDILADLGALADALSPGDMSRLFLIVSSGQARALAFKPTTSGARAFPEMSITGGRIGGVDVIPSDHLPTAGSPATPTPIMIDAAQLVLAAGDVVLRAGVHASVEMDDAPSQSGGTGSPVAPVATDVVSLWQNNLVGLRAERRFGYVKVRPTAAAVLAGAAW